MKKFTLAAFISILLFFCCRSDQQSGGDIEKWSIFEAQLHGSTSGNPFKDVKITAIFSNLKKQQEITGFYAGNGIYAIRFMPDEIGEWSYLTRSNIPQLDGKRGTFKCVEPTGNNRGPVRVDHTFHFRYADGTPFRQVGTTCYAWVHQGDSLELKTLESLKNSPFNKLRMCIFPKDYTFNKNEPIYYPFERDSLGNNDYSRFDPDFWNHLDQRLKNLLELGIEADIILFHPYDRWGYAVMPDSTDEFYLDYVLARLSAYRHVWWSAANEFDFMHNKDLAGWHRIFEILDKKDPYQHLRSIHNGAVFYDHSLPWITHASIQSTHFDSALVWRERYKKPLIYDECRYEGNVRFGWGNLTPQEMTAMFWKSLIAGTYAGHGETYTHPQDILWWSKGGELHGQSPARIAFFKKFLDETPETGLEPIGPNAAGKHGEQYLYYFDEQAPTEWTFDLSEHVYYQVEVMDTWETKCDTLGDKFHGKFTIHLPGKKYMAVRLTKSDLIFPIKDPDYRPRGSLFYDRIKVRLLHPYPATLRYTLDGSVPDLQSMPYVGEILISNDTRLRALSIEGDRMSNLLAVDFKKAELKPAVIAHQLKSGLQYHFFKGKWEKMPNFARLEPIKKGWVSRIDFSMVEDENEDYFGVVYSGIIEIPEDDVYTFYSSSDDGSFVFIDDQKIIENDGVHGVVEKMGQIGLAKGYHRFKVWFFDNWYDHYLKVEIESKNLPRQEIGSEWLFHQTNE